MEGARKGAGASSAYFIENTEDDDDELRNEQSLEDDSVVNGLLSTSSNPISSNPSSHSYDRESDGNGRHEFGGEIAMSTR